MSDIYTMYEVSIKDHRRSLKKLVRENNQCYESLKDKKSGFALSVKKLGDLHKKALEIYESAPDTLRPQR